MRDRTERADLARAWDLVAFLLGERRTSPGPVRPAVLRELARLHRLDTMLAQPRLTAVSPAEHVDEETWRGWQAARKAALAQVIARGPASRRALDRLFPLPVIVIKGCAAAELLYPSPADRSTGDLDVLVRMQDLAEALERLTDAGFSRHNAGDPSFDSPTSPERQLGSPELDLDLHQAFTHQARLPIDYDAVFARSLPWPAFAPNARLLAPEDAVVYQTVHAGCGELSVATAPALGLFDLRLMLARKGPFWGAAGGPALDLDAAVRRAAEWGAERMFYAVLSAASRIFPSLSPAASDAAEAVPMLIRTLLDRVIVDQASPPRLRAPPRAAVLVRKALLIRPAARLRLLRYRLPQVAAARRRRPAKARPMVV